MLFGDQTHRHVNQYGKVDIWLHGSLMLQYIFGFDDPYKVTKSLLALEPKEIVHIANDKSGSHVIETFLHSQTVAPKHKALLVDRLRGNYLDMANDRFGSRIVDYILSTVDFKLKSFIMDELVEKDGPPHLPNARNGGYFMAKKPGLYHYNKNRFEDWRNGDDDRFKVKRRRPMEAMFADSAEPRIRMQRFK